MYTAGYRFFVIPDAFLVDIPHTEKGPAQTDDNHKLSNALWKSFYRFVPNRYGIDGLPPYKVCMCLKSLRHTLMTVTYDVDDLVVGLSFFLGYGVESRL
ncbi:hypothetical protein SARC_17911, partial [Sphaeroforma arctica JP610]